jgi:hypothetical protein
MIMPQLRIINGFEKMTDVDFLAKTRLVVSEMTGNTNFATPTPALASITTLADAFETAIAVAEAGGSYDKSVRDNKKGELIDAMHNLSSYVLFTAAGDSLVAESSGFDLAKPASPQGPLAKPEGLLLSDGINSGELFLVFDKVRGARSYIYQIALDPLSENTQWTTAHGTVRKNLFTGLESGKKYWVRVAAVGINGQVVYSDPVARIVQ